MAERQIVRRPASHGLRSARDDNGDEEDETDEEPSLESDHACCSKTVTLEETDRTTG